MPPSTASHWRLLASLLAPQRRLMAGLAIVLTVASLLPLAGPQLLRAFIDRAAAGGELSALAAIAVAYVVLGLASQGAAVATAYAATRAAWSATNALRERALDHVLRLDLAFHKATSPGALVERIDGDATAITRFFTDFALKVAGGALTLAGAVVLVALEDWRVGVGMAALAGGAVALIIRLRDRAVLHASDERAAYADVIGLVEEQLDGADDLRALGAADFALDRHELASGRLKAAAGRAERASAEIWTVTTGAFAAGGACALLVGWLLERRGAITLGTVFLLFAYTQVLRGPVEQIAEQLQQVQRAAAGARRMSTLFAERSRLNGGGSAPLPEAGALGLRFDGVGFSYPEDGRPVLADIDLEVPAGGVLALVGRTGSGKTTLARLALRLADPTSGRVLLDGVDLREIEPDLLRRRAAVVTQDVQLFTASVRDNLTLFRRGADDETLTRLLSDLGLQRWLESLDDGLDSQISPRSLSAGQAQLLAVARAFVADPGLVVLDEASSRIDPVTAELVEAAFDRLLAGRTGVVIAHRLRAVRRADRVAVLDDGRVAEHGDREALAADPGSRFAELLRLEGTGAA